MANTNLLSQAVGYAGIVITGAASIPQIRNTKKVSKATYSMLLIGISCYLVRALEIHETIWAASSVFSLITIYMVWRKL